MKRSLFALLSLLVLASLVLAACGGAAEPTEAPAETEAPAATEEPAEATEEVAACEPVGTEPIAFPDGGKSVTGAFDQEPDAVVPYFTQMSYAVWVTQLTLVGLGEWTDEGTFVPELAAEIPSADNGGVSEDGLTITWKLKDCLFWSDGTPLTSEDVKFTWEFVMDPGNAVSTRTGYDKIASVETPDATTVVVTFAELYPAWPTLFTQGPNNSGGILPKHILEGVTAAESDPFIRMPTVSSGPFVITEWVPGDYMELLPNPNFYKGRAILDRIQIRFVADSAAALAALQTGDVDFYPNFSEGDIATLESLAPAVVLTVDPGSNFEHYFFNMGRVDGVDGRGAADNEGFCPFKDVRVRKAIALGINRQAIVDALLSGKTTVPVSQWPNSGWTNQDLTVDAYDPEAAAALLDEAGYTLGADGIRAGDCNGEQVKLSFNFETTTAPIRMDIATAAQADLAQIGVEFIPIFTPAGTFFGQYVDGGPLTTGNYDMGGYTTGFYPDPYTNSYKCEEIPTAENPSGNNWYHLCDPALSDLIESSLATVDPAERKAILDEAQAYIAENYYVIMMYARANVFGTTPRFQFGPTGGDSHMNWQAEIWDVTE
ncbi:MAG: peptide ABC transporter substrate-binding protein [Anaerolineales bacterium]|nr:peptide ABC transporter substrate-binding protein [Anaerolineales bacterium]